MPDKLDGPVKDQNGVVWFGNTLMSADAWRALCAEYPHLPNYEDLPPWDSHDQNVVDVD